MLAIPYENIAIVTELDLQTLRDRLQSAIGPEKDFKGELTTNGFRFRRNTRAWGRDPYRPVIHGTFNSTPKGIEVALSFWPSPVELAQVVSLFGFAEYLAISKDISMWWWPIAAFVFVHLGLYVFSFVPGQRWGESRLRRILEPAS
jgi:hypothetical protein